VPSHDCPQPLKQHLLLVDSQLPSFKQLSSHLVLLSPEKMPGEGQKPDEDLTWHSVSRLNWMLEILRSSSFCSGMCITTWPTTASESFSFEQFSVKQLNWISSVLVCNSSVETKATVVLLDRVSINWAVRVIESLRDRAWYRNDTVTRHCGSSNFGPVISLVPELYKNSGFMPLWIPSSVNSAQI
jgi:hypothetical protein